LSEVEGYPETLEGCIHQTFHVIAEKHKIDVDLIAEIISEYDEIMSTHLDRKIVIEEN